MAVSVYKLRVDFAEGPMLIIWFGIPLLVNMKVFDGKDTFIYYDLCKIKV